MAGGGGRGSQGLALLARRGRAWPAAQHASGAVPRSTRGPARSSRAPPPCHCPPSPVSLRPGGARLAEGGGGHGPRRLPANGRQQQGQQHRASSSSTPTAPLPPKHGHGPAAPRARRCAPLPLLLNRIPRSASHGGGATLRGLHGRPRRAPDLGNGPRRTLVRLLPVEDGMAPSWWQVEGGVPATALAGEDGLACAGQRRPATGSLNLFYLFDCSLSLSYRTAVLIYLIGSISVRGQRIYTEWRSP